MDPKLKTGLVVGIPAAILSIIILGIMLATLPFIGPVGFFLFILAAAVPPIIAAVVITTIAAPTPHLSSYTSPTPTIHVGGGYSPTPVIVHNPPTTYYNTTPTIIHTGGPHMRHNPNPRLPMHGGPAPLPPVVGRVHPQQPAFGHGNPPIPAQHYPTRNSDGSVQIDSTNTYQTVAQTGLLRYPQVRTVNPSLRTMDQYSK